MCCSCIPYPCRTTFGVKRFLLLCQLAIFIFSYPHLFFFICCFFVFCGSAVCLSLIFCFFFSDTSCPFLCAFECCLFYVHFFLQKPFSIAIVGFFGSSTNYILIYTFFICATISFLSLSHSVLLLQGRSLISNILQITMPNSSNNI